MVLEVDADRIDASDHDVEEPLLREPLRFNLPETAARGEPHEDHLPTPGTDRLDPRAAS